MRQVCSILSTYTADVSGVCSALYEMGGMVIMHDASGCNSTYNTHDEPRWYDTPSMVYISALSEHEAILGDDEKLIKDVCHAAKELSPRFIAVAGTPIPMMMGTDFQAVAKEIEKRTGIPTFGFATNGMHSYLCGESMAFRAITERFCSIYAKSTEENSNPAPCSSKSISVNLLGVTPLDFSVTGNAESIKKLCNENDIKVQCCFSMGSSFDELMNCTDADVSWVLSSSGLSQAKYLEKEFNIPYIIGVPIGEIYTKRLFADLKEAALTGKSRPFFHVREDAPQPDKCDKAAPSYITGEPVFAASLRNALEAERDIKGLRILTPLENLCDRDMLRSGDITEAEEDDFFRLYEDADLIFADPLFKPALSDSSHARFFSLPHEACSGRIFRKDIPVLIGKGFKKLYIE